MMKQYLSLLHIHNEAQERNNKNKLTADSYLPLMFLEPIFSPEMTEVIDNTEAIQSQITFMTAQRGDG